MADETDSKDDKMKKRRERRAERKAARAAEKTSVEVAEERSVAERKESRRRRREERRAKVAIVSQPSDSNANKEAKKLARKARRAQIKHAKEADKEGKRAQRKLRRKQKADTAERAEAEQKASQSDRRKNRKAKNNADGSMDGSDGDVRKKGGKRNKKGKGKKKEKKRDLKQKSGKRQQNDAEETGALLSFPMQQSSTEMVVSFSALDAVALAGLQRQRFVVDVHGVVFHGYFERSDQAGLFVLLSGEAPNGGAPRPHFERRAWGEMLPGSVLWISDPALDLSDDMSLGWYVGTREKDYSLEMAKLVDKIAADLRLTRSEIVFYAGSGGGFAALMCARHLPGATCIVINPEIVLAKHADEEHLEKLAQYFSGQADFERIANEHPERVSILAAFPSADSLPPTVYVQNRHDTHHFDEHYALFCQRYSVPPEGGISANGQVLSLLFEHGSGHVREPRPMVRPLLEQALVFFRRFRQPAK